MTITFSLDWISYFIWSENLEGRDHSQDMVVDGKVILQWILEK